MRERQKGRLSCHMCLLFFLVKRNLSSQTTMSKSKKVIFFHSLKNMGSNQHFHNCISYVSKFLGELFTQIKFVKTNEFTNKEAQDMRNKKI